MIETKALGKNYGKKVAVTGLDLAVAPGEVLGFLGPNGAGKSTTVKILTGMIKPTSGTASVAGFDVVKDPLEVKRRIGYVPEAGALFEALTGAEYLAMVGGLKALEATATAGRIEELLELFDIADAADSRLGEYSKGMKQKVLISAALLGNPEVLFLDEPLNGLDTNAAAVVKQLLRELAAANRTVLFCSHILEVVERVCDPDVVASPADFDVLGYQPISSRTYFLSRLTNLMIYAGFIGALTGAPSLLVVCIGHGLLAGAGWLIALVLAVVWVVLIVTTGYAAVLNVVPADRLRRYLGYLQLLTSTLVYGSVFLVPLLLGSRIAESILLEPDPWLLLYPPAWFAFVPRLMTGSFDAVGMLALLGALGSTAAMAALARGRLSLAYAERLGAFFAAGGTPAKRRSPRRAQGRGVAGWRVLVPAEMRIMGMLIRAQFRHDMRFRMVVLSAFPLALCVLAVPILARLGANAVRLESFMAIGLVHLSTILLPLTLLDNLRYSDSFRASWIFFSTPSDPARLTVQAVNCTAIFFLLPYLAMVAAALAWIFEDVLRGVSHVLLLGFSTVVALQLGLLCAPLIPFSEPPPKGRQSGRQIVFVIVASVVSYAVLPPLIRFATSGATLFAVVSFVLIACCAMLQRILAGRIRQRVEKIEFVG